MKAIRTKIVLYKKHVGYVNTDLKKRFMAMSNVKNYVGWIRDLAFRRFSISLWSAEDVGKLSAEVSKLCYQNIGDWLDDCMRRVVFEGASTQGV